jgi:methylmalonyl-CoA/ethylmalonyl-CoA epimerase
VSIGRIDHIGIVVGSIDEALPRYRSLFGLHPIGPLITVASQGVRLCFLPSGSGPAARLELVEPVDPGSGVARFLDERGEGLHHVCFSSGDLAADLAALEAHGAELIDRQPRPGADGVVAFIHPRTLSGVLWELLQDDGEGEERPHANP